MRAVEALTGKVCGGQSPDRQGAGEVKVEVEATLKLKTQPCFATKADLYQVRKP